MIDGIVSGKLLLKPKMLKTSRGSNYLIAKLQVYGYQTGNIEATTMHGDLIAFDRDVCHELAECAAGAVVTVCGIITPVQEESLGQTETVLKITAKALIQDYAGKQQQGNGSLFALVRQAIKA